MIMARPRQLRKESVHWVGFSFRGVRSPLPLWQGSGSRHAAGAVAESSACWGTVSKAERARSLGTAQLLKSQSLPAVTHLLIFLNSSTNFRPSIQIYVLWDPFSNHYRSHVIYIRAHGRGHFYNSIRGSLVKVIFFFTSYHIPLSSCESF